MTTPTQRRLAWWRLTAAALLISSFAAPAWAEQTDEVPAHEPEVLTLDEAAQVLRVPADELGRLARRSAVPARRIANEWRFNRDALLAWLNGDWHLIVAAVPPSVDVLSAEAMMAVAGAGTSGTRGQIASAGQNGGNDNGARDPDAPIGEAPQERTAEEVFLRAEKVLLAPGEVTLETGLFYSETDNQQLAVANGALGLATVEQQTFTTLLQGRIGVLDETELFVSTTLFDQDSDLFLGGSKIADSDRAEFGAVDVGVRRTLLMEGPGRPGIIATVDGSIPTGDTSFAVGGGLAFVKSIDPVVLFANVSYTHTFSRDFADVSRLEPKDRVDATVGYALALNDTLTLSTAVSGVFSSGTRFTAAELRQSDDFSLQFGLTSWLAKGLYIEPTVSFNLNGPGDSVVLGLTLPYTFMP